MDAFILPADTLTALQKMTCITRDMITATEQETNSIALGDNLAFGDHARSKQMYFSIYRQAAQEFFSRQQEFFALKSGSLEELCQLQARLKSEIGINMNFLDKIRHYPDFKKLS